MKLTRKQLRHIILEETQGLNESFSMRGGSMPTYKGKTGDGYMDIEISFSNISNKTFMSIQVSQGDEFLGSMSADTRDGDFKKFIDAVSNMINETKTEAPQ